MRMLGRVIILSLLVVGLSLAAAAQGYEPPTQANHKDVYCSGFVASSPLPANLRIVMAEDAVGGVMYSQYDYIYLSQGRNGGVSLGQRYQVVRPVNDPNPVQAFDRQQPIFKAIGQLYMDLGWVEVTGVHETTATALVQEACEGLNAGDVLIPFENRPVPEYKPSVTFDRFAPMQSRGDATLMMGKDFGSAFGQGDVVYINLGTSQGVKAGDYFRVYRYASGTIYEGYRKAGQGQSRHLRGMPYGYEIPIMRKDLPREVLGEAFVVRVDGNASTALVTLSLGEMHAGDFVELEPPAPPAAHLTVTPASILRGATATLSWHAQAAEEITLEPRMGAVEKRGTVNVNPTQTVTYTLRARGPGGETQAAATLTVIQPAPAPTPAAPALAPSMQDLFAQSVQDIFFEFDKSDITAEAAASLQRTADFLRSYPDARVSVEGHCDEVGGPRYNLRLGARRAEAVKNYLVSLGVNAGQLEAVSRGQDAPFCTESSQDSCRALNRRVHFALQ